MKNKTKDSYLLFIMIMAIATFVIVLTFKKALDSMNEKVSAIHLLLDNSDTCRDLELD